MKLTQQQLEIGLQYAEQHYKLALFEKQQMLKKLKLKQTDHVLLFGCGYGVSSCWIANEVEYIVSVVTDRIDRRKLKIAQRLQQHTNSNSLVCIDSTLQNANFKQQFDVIILNDVIDHLLSCSIEELVTTVDNHLADNGRLFISLPSFYGTMNFEQVERNNLQKLEELFAVKVEQAIVV